MRDSGALSKFQSGFGKGYSTVDDIFSVIQMKWYETCKANIYGFFVDFKAAFDRVNRSALFYKLNQKGVSNKFLNVLNRMYDSMTAV